MSKVLVLAEHANGALKGATLHAVTAATELSGGDAVDLLLIGHALAEVAAAAATIQGLSRVLVLDSAEAVHPLAEVVAPILAQIARSGGYGHMVVAATASGKNIAPRAAALLDTQQVSDVLRIIDAETFERPIYAGNALATVRSADAVKLLTIRTTAFAAAADGGAAVPVEALTLAVPAEAMSRFVKAELAVSARPELAGARIVVSGGRGLGSGENFRIVEDLADALGAAVGASRAAVDAGYVPNDYQVGQTGKVVAPELYVAVGISGAIQHLAGMKDSKVIVAINKDAEAPIFQVADYGLVADLFTAVPALAAGIRQAKGA